WAGGPPRPGPPGRGAAPRRRPRGPRRRTPSGPRRREGRGRGRRRRRSAGEPVRGRRLPGRARPWAGLPLSVRVSTPDPTHVPGSPDGRIGARRRSGRAGAAGVDGGGRSALSVAGARFAGGGPGAAPP